MEKVRSKISWYTPFKQIWTSVIIYVRSTQFRFGRIRIRIMVFNFKKLLVCTTIHIICTSSLHTLVTKIAGYSPVAYLGLVAGYNTLLENSNWWHYCLALCDEIFDHLALLDETLRHIELCNSLISHTYPAKSAKTFLTVYRCLICGTQAWGPLSDIGRMGTFYTLYLQHSIWWIRSFLLYPFMWYT